MSDEVIAFFDFKVDLSGILRLGVIEVCSLTLERIGGSLSVLQTSESRKHALTFLEIYDMIYDMLNERIWIGHGIMESDVPRLKKACAVIGKEPPRAKSIIDTHYFLLFGTKLAKLAVHFGLGNRGRVSDNDYCLQNINAFKHCEAVMSLYEQDQMKNYGDDMHPMVSHLIDVSADVTARFGELDIAS